MIPISNPRSQLIPIEAEILSAIKDVLQSGNYILGENVSTLEAEIAKKLQVSECIAVANGTDALTLALHACGIGEGDEVITTTFSFFATAEAISRVGAKVIFIDVDEKTFNLDHNKILENITTATKAIIPVHLFGQPANMNEINKIASEHNLRVIEDACQAFGAMYQGKPVGSLGDVACFSFFPTKNLSTIGDGGIITTSDPTIAKRIRSLRAHGSKKKYFHDEIGYNSRLDEIHAAIIRICLEHIDDWNEKRKSLAARYNKKLKDIHIIKTPFASNQSTHVYHLYCLESEYREKIIEELYKQNIQTGIYYPCSIHLQKAYKHLAYQVGDFPIAESLSKKLFAIPLYPALSYKDQDKVINALKTIKVCHS
ncbi:DegT/DnrJ/EryC1/StrS family aminotransferase, partial [Pseudogracilibacillus sp. SO30301A]|uniref:DegT/DnrJ/EryC1/StrS family aminotransferase n=1 Tax=Pseudogracilibacillus sp. SO30301A TaxID=3098291 RepID=UPI00300DC3BE